MRLRLSPLGPAFPTEMRKAQHRASPPHALAVDDAFVLRIHIPYFARPRWEATVYTEAAHLCHNFLL